MTLADFIARFRLDRDDQADGKLWSDAEIRAYLNSAIDEVCERALLVEDTTTAACCEVTLVAGTSTYALHGAVIHVKRVKFNGLVLSETSDESLDRTDVYWETRTGDPLEYVLKNKSGLRVVPTPTAASVAKSSKLYLTVYRTQLVAITEDTDEDSDLSTLIGIPQIYHLRMLPWLYAQALRKVDTQTLDRDEADRQEAIFQTSFGVRPDANVQRKRRDRRPPIVRINW